MSTPGDSDNDKIKWNMQAQRAIDVQLERGRVGSARGSGDGVVWHGNEVEWRPVQKTASTTTKSKKRTHQSGDLSVKRQTLVRSANTWKHYIELNLNEALNHCDRFKGHLQTST